MNQISAAVAVAMGLAIGNGMPTIRLPTGGTRKVYPEDQARIEENYATRDARRQWNAAVDSAKEDKLWASRRTFVPRKSSHKQG